MATYFKGDEDKSVRNDASRDVDRASQSVYDDEFQSLVDSGALNQDGREQDSTNAERGVSVGDNTKKPDSNEANPKKGKTPGQASVVSEEKQGLYRRSSGALKKGFKGKKKSGKKKLLLIASGIGMPTVALFLILYSLTGFSLENMVRISNAYRFSTAHRHLATLTRQMLVVDSVLSPESKAAPKSVVGGNSLFERFKNGGWTPEKALRSLGATDIKLTFDSSNTLIEIEQGTTQDRKKITSEGKSKNQWGREVAQFTDSALTDNGRKSFHRRKTINFTRSLTGSKLTVFRKFIEARDKNQTLSADDGKRLLLEERINRSQGDGQRPRSSLPGVEDAAKDQVEDAKKGTIKKGHRLTPRQVTTINAVQQTSQYAFYITLYCIANQVANGIEAAIEQRVGSLSRFAQGNDTAVDQFHAGDATQEALRATDADIQGYQKSQAYAMGTGRGRQTVAKEDMLAPSDLPLRIGPFTVGQIKTIASVISGSASPMFLPPGVSLGGVLNSLCGYILNPVAQAAIGLVDLGLTLVTLGSSEVIEQGVGRAISKIVVTAIGISLGLELILDMFSSITDTVAGLGAVTVDGQEFANKDDAGRLLNKNSQFVNYANTLPAEEAARQARQGVEDFQRNERSKGALYAYFSPNNPFSFTSSLVTTLPRNFSSFAQFAGDSFKSLFSPASTFGSVFTPAGAIDDWPPEMVFYGMEDMQVGFTQGQVDGSDPRLNFLNVVDIVEADLPRFKAEYGECVAVGIYDYALNGVSDKCNSAEGGLYKMYFTMCDTAAAVSLVGSAIDSYATEDCLDLAGASQSEFKLTKGPTSSGGPGGGVADLDVKLDGPVYECTGTSTVPARSDVQSGDSINWSGITPTGTLGPDSNQEQIEVYIREACNTTNQRTVLLVGSIHGSENAGQLVAYEMLFNKELDPDIRVIAVPELCSCAGTGTRGNNGNDNGKKIDLNRNFPYQWSSLPQTARIPSDVSVPGTFYSKGASAGSENETQAFMNFANSIGAEVDLLIAFHDGITYVAASNNTPASVAQAYVDGSNAVVPFRLKEGENGKVYQSGSLDGWFNSKFGKNSLLVEMGKGSVPEQRIPDHVNGVISALNAQ